MRARLGVIAVLLFGSGLAALVYQTAWQKMFRLVFGASTWASAAVLAIFMGGLGLGGALFGKRAEASTRPLLLYGNLELGVAVLAGISPFLIQLVDAFYLYLGGVERLGLGFATVVRLVLACVVMGPAAVLMGGTMPAAARAALSDTDAGRVGLARLYALNTLGAVLGALIGPLIAFGVLGVQLTVWAAVCINLLVALFARSLGRAVDPLPVAKSGELEVQTASTPRPAPATEGVVRAPVLGSAPAARPALIYGMAGLVGFVFLFMELVWFRMLAPILGGSTITFGLVLAVALFGIGLGGFIYSRRPAEAQSDVMLLAGTLAFEALFVALPFAWGDGLARLTAHLRAMENLGYAYLVAGWLAVTAVVVLPAAIVSGYQFPVLVSLLGRGRIGVAREVGLTYAFNTVGTILGSLLGGLLLITTLGAVQSWRLVGLVLVVGSAICLVVGLRAGSSKGRSAVTAVTSLAALSLFLAEGPGFVWRHTPIGAGRVELAGKTQNEVRLWEYQNSHLIWARDGIESAVAIGASDGIAFIVDGKSDGAVVADRGTQTMLGLIAAALHEEPKDTFLIGLGTGVSAGMLAAMPTMEQVDVAELEPAIVRVAEEARLANEDVLANEKMRLIFGDAREILRASQRNYDLIVSEPSNPYRIGIASLFTREYYEATAARLRPGGVFAQWLQGYETNAFVVATALHTLRSVFDHVSVWSSDAGDFVLIATMEPQVIDVQRLRKASQSEPFAEWMPRAWDMAGAEAFLAHLLVPDRAVDGLLEVSSGTVNTDDLNVLEYAFAKNVGQGDYRATRDVFLFMKEGAKREPEIVGPHDAQRVTDLRHRAFGFSFGQPSTFGRAVAVGCRGALQRGREMLPENVEPRDPIERWIVASKMAVEGDARALEHARLLAERSFAAAAHLVRHGYHASRGEHEKSFVQLSRALAALRHEALPPCDLATFALQQAEAMGTARPEFTERLLDAVAAGPLAVYQKEALRWNVQFNLATSLDDPQKCAAKMGPYREKPQWSERVLTKRLTCLQAAKHPLAARAAQDLEEFLQREAPRFSLHSHD